MSLSTLRGTCYQTTTCSTGQPFGLLASGLLSKGMHTWVSKYLHALDVLAAQHTREHPEAYVPAFMLPALDEDGFIFPLEPRLRHHLGMPWASSPPELPALNFTLHSLKTTLFSMGLQIDVAEADRRRQGHHRFSSSEWYAIVVMMFTG